MNTKLFAASAVFSVVGLILVLTSVFMKEESTSTTTAAVTNEYNIAEWTLTKQCSDGTTIYQLPDGDYAIYRGNDEEDQHWVKLTKGVEPEDYC